MTQDHREKVIDKLLKLQRQRDGEAALGNTAAAEAFASAINRMLLEHELQPSDLDYKVWSDQDPVVEIRVDLPKYDIKLKKVRSAWQERLAMKVADAHLCRILVHQGSNQITFVGTKSHATVAEYAYGTLASAAIRLCDDAYREYGYEVARSMGVDGWRAGQPGFRESWLGAFIGRITERFDEARRAAVRTVTPTSSSTALVRLDTALVRVRDYIKDRYTRNASSLKRIRVEHEEGRRRGRAAADKMNIGQRGVEGSGGPSKLLKG